jgi:uncharacterized repeat protein (TIGR03803 family)
MDASGNIYGLGNSAAFELSPNGSGGWNSEVIYNFMSVTGESPNPVGSPVLDKAGNIYIATYHGGTHQGSTHQADGKVFELLHKKTTWVQKVLYDFGSFAEDGTNPNAGLVLDSSGNIYGTTLNGGSSNYGTVFELVAPLGTGAYEEKILANFDGTNGRAPYASLIFDNSGKLYGTTFIGGSNNAGTVFKVTP